LQVAVGRVTVTLAGRGHMEDAAARQQDLSLMLLLDQVGRSNMYGVRSGGQQDRIRES
jgi:ABC-type taurine transport system substrate-binding protein